MTVEAGGVTPFSVRTIGPEPEGATPIDADDLQGLIPDFVATRADLNQVEYENIAKALPWAQERAKRLGPAGVLDYAFLFALHSRMFGDVWKWAGTKRRRETNIGVSPHLIPGQVKQALDDALFWHEHGTFPVDERAARIHFRLVKVHPFPNGNGRCTRLFADLYLASIGTPPFTWGTGDLDDQSETRSDYMAALRLAEADDFASLVSFARR